MMPEVVNLRRWLFRFIVFTGFAAFFSGCSTTAYTVPAQSASKPVQKIEKKIEKKTASPALDYYSGGEESRPYKVLGKWYRPLSHARGFKQQGIASWYGDEFHGRKTSSGEIYNMYAVSAAHKTLPLHTYVRVRNLQNGKTLDLRINDRGPFVAGRIIDLSYGAAQKLAILGPGTAPVEVTALGTASMPKTNNKSISYKSGNYNQGHFTIQVGAFGERKNAEKLVKELVPSYKHAYIKQSACPKNKQTIYRVLVGKCSSLQQAEKYEYHLKSKGFPDAFTIAE